MKYDDINYALMKFILYFWILKSYHKITVHTFFTCALLWVDSHSPWHSLWVQMTQKWVICGRLEIRLWWEIKLQLWIPFIICMLQQYLKTAFRARWMDPIVQPLPATIGLQCHLLYIMWHLDFLIRATLYNTFVDKFLNGHIK